MSHLYETSRLHNFKHFILDTLCVKTSIMLFICFVYPTQICFGSQPEFVLAWCTDIINRVIKYIISIYHRNKNHSTHMTLREIFIFNETIMLQWNALMCWWRFSNFFRGVIICLFLQDFVCTNIFQSQLTSLLNVLLNNRRVLI